MRSHIADGDGAEGRGEKEKRGEGGGRLRPDRRIEFIPTLPWCRISERCSHCDILPLSVPKIILTPTLTALERFGAAEKGEGKEGKEKREGREGLVASRM